EGFGSSGRDVVRGGGDVRPVCGAPRSFRTPCRDWPFSRMLHLVRFHFGGTRDSGAGGWYCGWHVGGRRMPEPVRPGIAEAPSAGAGLSVRSAESSPAGDGRRKRLRYRHGSGIPDSRVAALEGDTFRAVLDTYDSDRSEAEPEQQALHGNVVAVGIRPQVT